MGGRLRWPVAALAVAALIVGALASLWFADAMRKAAGTDPLFGSAMQAWMLAGSVLAAVIVVLALVADSRHRPPPPQFFPPTLLPAEPPAGPQYGQPDSWNWDDWNDRNRGN